LLLAAHQLPAQLKSVPVYAVTAARPGWAAALDYGSGINQASGHARHWGARAAGGFGRLQVALAAGVWDAGASASAQFGGTALLRALGRPSGGLALHALAGAGYARAGAGSSATTYVTVPLGVAVVHSGFHTSRGALTPWLTSRVEIVREAFAGFRPSQAGVGVSGGVAAAVRGRLGAHVALEWLKLFERRGAGVTLSGGDRITAGVGVHVLLSGTP